MQHYFPGNKTLAWLWVVFGLMLFSFSLFLLVISILNEWYPVDSAYIAPHSFVNRLGLIATGFLAMPFLLRCAHVCGTTVKISGDTTRVTTWYGRSYQITEPFLWYDNRMSFFFTPKSHHDVLIPSSTNYRLKTRNHEFFVNSMDPSELDTIVRYRHSVDA